MDFIFWHAFWVDLNFFAVLILFFHPSGGDKILDYETT